MQIHDQLYMNVAKIISGTTSGTANTPVAFPHGLGFTPRGGVIINGNAYVSSFDGTNINVASAGISQAFTVAVIKSPK